jgi:phosphoglycerate dehydrogenase-like enzyme
MEGAAKVRDVTVPRVAIGPVRSEFADRTVRDGGGEPVDVGARADALVWLDPADIDGLRQALATASSASWIQLPMAGIERVLADGLLDQGRTWTSAKGAYAEPVAEHALALALAGLRLLRLRITARSWGEAAGESLYDQPVTIVGGGGIAVKLLELLAPLRVTATVVRRRPDPVPGAARVLGTSRLQEAMAGARVVFLALALTPGTEHIVGADQLAWMQPGAWLVNVARGRLVDTGALLAALRQGTIGGAALDVTDPEPLPDGHPLWELPNCIITPHTADTEEMVQRLLAERIKANVARFAAGEPLIGLVDPAAGY